MGPARPQQKLDFSTLPSLLPKENSSRPGSTASSPVEPPQERQSRFAGAFGGMTSSASIRQGASSPSHELGGRLYSTRRTRELQQSDGHGWGPPVASGLSTPLREVIPESPGDDTFPDFVASSSDTRPLSRRPSVRDSRARAGTTPSRFPGLSEAPTSGGQQLRTTLSSRATPSGSPHRPSTASNTEADIPRTLPSSTSNPLLARIRADSQPSRAYPAISPFGSSIWSTNARPRSSTLGSHQSDESHDVPASDPMFDTDRKTLEMLGLEPTNLSSRVGDNARFTGARRPLNSDMNRVSSTRLRSYSTNYKDQYAKEEEAAAGQSPFGSGTLTPSSHAAAAILAANNAQLLQYNAKLQAQIEQHGSSLSPASRPRAQTTGLPASNASRLWRSDSVTSTVPPQHGQPLTSFDWSMDDSTDYASLTNAVHAMHLQNGTMGQDLTARDGQSRAIWLGGVPHHTTEELLKQIFEPFGKVDSARAMTQKGYAFVNFENVSSAVMAKLQYDGQEIFQGQGPTRIAFAKDPSNSATPGGHEGSHANGASMNGQQQQPQYSLPSHTVSAVPSTTLRGSGAEFKPASKLPQPVEMRDDIVAISKDFGANKDDSAKISGMIDRATQSYEYGLEIPPPPEPSQIRVHDAPRLREIRKRVENNVCSVQEMDDIAAGMLSEVVELSSDYLGNTVVQKLFEYCSEPTKEAMLGQIGPHLAQIGAHKNGTWAAQDIIRVATTHEQQNMIVDGLRPYGMASFLDQYGNYVMQGCLKFGPPANDFLFECMLNQLWNLAQARFGVRAMRACLESQEASRNQQRMMAAAIAICSNHLATNSNGALLLTWYLDTCTFKNRRKILAPRLIPHLVQLCTHKVAYMTVLKLVNQKEEPDARQQTLQALFFSKGDEVLEAVLRDQLCGATFIFKTLTTPFFDEHLRTDAVNNVRNILTKIKAQPNQSYKRLMDEVAMTKGQASEGRANGTSPKKSRANHQQMNGNAYPPHQSYVPNPVNGNYETFNANAASASPYAPNSLPSPMTPHHAQPYQHQTPYAQNRYSYGPVMNQNPYATPMSAGYGPTSRAQQAQFTPGPSPMPQMGYGPMMGMNQGAQWHQQQYGMPPSFSMPQQYQPDMMNGGGGGGRRGGRRS